MKTSKTSTARRGVMARVLLRDGDVDERNAVPGGGVFFSKRFARILASAAGLILLYFPLSIALTFYQRWIVQIIHFPLLIVLCHIVTKFLVAAICRHVWQCWHRQPRVCLDWPNLVTRIAPIGLFSGLDIAFSSWGLQFITVSLYTMTKSTSVIFILLFALILRLEEKNWSLVVIVGMISGGLIMFTYESTQFNLFGFLLVLFASFLSGLRWTVAQWVMQRPELRISSPLDMMYHVQPFMIAACFIVALSFEAHRAILAWSSMEFPKDWGFFCRATLYIAIGSGIATMLELSEFLIISRMSSLTLSIASVFKEVITLTLALEWSGDQISLFNAVGLLLSLSGMVLHTVSKAMKVKQNLTSNQHKPLLDEATAHFLADGTTSDEDEMNDDSSTEVLFSVLNSRDR